ncbi:hypothetical protein TVAG_286360 [Trichomonas vaginalis G3]|uniref:DUF3447 domain-containing protein n=1 Tax=Trichomonas vaginalis (strain ATCC PRA-98 / G3) TaxID=412133 RepID=A2EPF0_TRIV3|nr:spectrin binding [Trichomonas vaginalis G3]EAY05458.1 hypothetical protein TVAG_286360 [Trichomonas vaginalis G3]KAI5503564.1 spectrin binding [Trichomonas vaginalis G3]|eukprot:XP_001317681.1 hypothetical protein [Trichomonas vaginalis G3]
MDVDLYIELNQRYLDVDESNLKETASFIANCDIGNFSIGRTIIAQYFIKTFRVRPKKLNIIADLFAQVINTPATYNVKELPIKLLDYCFGYDNESDYKLKIRAFYFIRKLLSKGIYNIDSDILPRLLTNIEWHESCRPYIFNCCCWAPEIDHVRPGFFDKINLDHATDIEHLKDFFTHLEELRADGWSLFFRSIENEEVPGSIADIIMKDDIDSFINLGASNPDFNYNGVLPISFFEHRTMLQRGTHYIQAAAFFGSIQILKFLILKDIPINTKDMFEYITSQYAVCGGSLEAIRLCEQAGASFLGCAQLAIEYFQQDVLGWIYDNQPKKVWNLDMYNRGRIHNASLVGNLAAFLEAIETGDRIDQPMEDALPIILAVKCNSFEIVQYILLQNPEGVDKIIYQHQTLMQVAISYAKDEMIDLLIQMLPNWNHWQGFHKDLNDLYIAIHKRRPSLIMKLAERMHVIDNPTRCYFMNAAIRLGSFYAIRVMAEHPDMFPFNPKDIPENFNTIPELIDLLTEKHIISPERKELPEHAQIGYVYKESPDDYIKEKTGVMPDPFWICSTQRKSAKTVLQYLISSIYMGDPNLEFINYNSIGPLAYIEDSTELDTGAPDDDQQIDNDDDEEEEFFDDYEEEDGDDMVLTPAELAQLLMNLTNHDQEEGDHNDHNNDHHDHNNEIDHNNDDHHDEIDHNHHNDHHDDVNFP